MLEQLFSLIQNEGQTDIVNNPEIPNEFNNQAVGLATESIFSQLQGTLANGGLQDVMGLFSGKSQISGSNPLVHNISQGLISNLMNKLGITSAAAQRIAASLIPVVLEKLVSKTNDPNDNGFDINGILGSLLGGKTNHGGAVELPNQGPSIDFSQILSRVSSGGGMDIDGDGDVDLQDMIAAVSGAAGGIQQNNRQQGGGIMDLLGGFLK